MADLQTPALTVTVDTSLAELPALLARARGSNAIAVVDASGDLAGIIPTNLIIEDLLFDVMPEELLADLLDPDRAAELTRDLHAKNAGELMRAPVAVSAGASLREAAHLLRQSGLQGAPVVDEHGRVSGHIDLLDIMLAWWRRRHAGG